MKNQFELRLVNKVGKLTHSSKQRHSNPEATDDQASILVNTTSTESEPLASRKLTASKIATVNKLSSSSLSDLSETLSDVSDSAILETVIVDKSNSIKGGSRKVKGHADNMNSSRKTNHRQSKSRKNQAKRLIPSRSMCCSKKCGALALVAVYISLDTLFNLFFVTFSAKITKSFVLTPNITKSFNKVPTYENFNIKTSTYDVWVVSLVRDALLFLVILAVGIRHKLIHRFIRFVHKKYISALLCLFMYSYSMLKMLLHSDQAFIDKRASDNTSMLMFIWNIIAAFLFFIAWYMLALLKPKECYYQKTNIDGGDMGENDMEEDIFLETLKETKKKRSSLLRLFRYSGPDWHFILIGTIFLIAGSICKCAKLFNLARYIPIC